MTWVRLPGTSSQTSCKHVGEQRSSSDIEGNAETHVAGSLVQLAVKVSLGLAIGGAFSRLRLHGGTGDINWANMWQGAARVLVGMSFGFQAPEDHAAVVRIRAELAYDLSQLINAPGRNSRSSHPRVRHQSAATGSRISRPRSPTSQVSDPGCREFARSILIPDLDLDLRSARGMMCWLR